MEQIKKTKKVDNEEWKLLYEYVKKEILEYESSKKVPRTMVLRLRGLRDGNFMSNKHNKNKLADYGYDIILLTFKLNKITIKNGISNKSKFKDESHMINYIMAIVESKINDTLDRINKAKKSQNKAEVIDINNEVENKATYKKKTKEVKNSRLKELL